ncbi:DUF2806 domain-containing protein [Aeromonas enteropelogenes]|uniref:DUF2806 domain-containing protein n=1 Tax=Aeromonas enteropelogenes TaxID=29489 RepID=UPI003B9E7702
MSDGNSLINFGDLSKPATVLIEKVSSAVGIIFEPYHIKRKARAEAEAEKIRVLARIELTDLEQRAVLRFVEQEARKQDNIESITAQAASQLPPDAKVENLEEDWVAHFFKQCDSVSDQEMQSLWASLLLGEAAKPGSFSKRTIDLVSSIDKRDAELFTKFCQFVWMVGEPTPLIYETGDDIYTKEGITFSALKHLDSIGLISFESMSGYKRRGFAKYVHFFYFGQPTLVEFPKDENNDIALGKALLTSTGKELVAVCGAKRNQEFYEYVTNRWFKENLVLSSIRRFE